MIVELKPIQYIDYKVYNITTIKNKYGFRIVLYLENGDKKTLQHSGFERKDIAEKERCKIISQLENKTYVVYTNITVKTYMEYWFEYEMPKRISAYNTYMSYRNVIFNYIIPKIGKLNLISLSVQIIENLYREVNSIYPSVCEILQTVMTTALDDAKKNNFIRNNVAYKIKIPKSDKEIEKEKTTRCEKSYHTLKIDERKTFTVEDVLTLIKKSKDTPIYLHVLFATLLGLRKSEINGIKYSDIDFIHKKLYLKIQLRKKY